MFSLINLVICLPLHLAKNCRHNIGVPTLTNLYSSHIRLLTGCHHISYLCNFAQILRHAFSNKTFTKTFKANTSAEIALHKEKENEHNLIKDLF